MAVHLRMEMLSGLIFRTLTVEHIGYFESESQVASPVGDSSSGFCDSSDSSFRDNISNFEQESNSKKGIYLVVMTNILYHFGEGS